MFLWLHRKKLFTIFITVTEVAIVIVTYILFVKIYGNCSGCQVHRSGFTVDIHSIRRGLWQESDELLIYLQIETKFFILIIRQYFISLTVNLEL